MCKITISCCFLSWVAALTSFRKFPNAFAVCCCNLSDTWDALHLLHPRWVQLAWNGLLTAAQLWRALVCLVVLQKVDKVKLLGQRVSD